MVKEGRKEIEREKEKKETEQEKWETGLCMDMEAAISRSKLNFC